MAKLGDRVRDEISGFEGIVTGRAEYLYGCVQVLVNPAEVKDGSPIAGTWLDEDRTVPVVKEAFAPPASAKERAGGPVTAPPSGAR
jgi:hypothetical protein